MYISIGFILNVLLVYEPSSIMSPCLVLSHAHSNSFTKFSFKKKHLKCEKILIYLLIFLGVLFIFILKFYFFFNLSIVLKKNLLQNKYLFMILMQNFLHVYLFYS